MTITRFNIFALIVVTLTLSSGVAFYTQKRDSEIIARQQKLIADCKNEIEALNDLLNAYQNQLKAQLDSSPDTLIVVRQSKFVPDWFYYQSGKSRSVEFTGAYGLDYEIRFRDDEITTPLLRIFSYRALLNKYEVLEIIKTLGVSIDQNDFASLIVRTSVPRTETWWKNWAKVADEKLRVQFQNREE